MLAKLLWKGLRLVLKRGPDFEIYDVDSREAGQVPYMLRWYLTPRVKWLPKVYLHCFLRSDKDVPHDHPWHSLSLVLKGTMLEERPGHPTRRLIAGDWSWRPATFAHRIVIEPGEVAWTLFFMTPKVREWGFLCPKGWRHWSDFVKADEPGKPGGGCGEDH